MHTRWRRLVPTILLLMLGLTLLLTAPPQPVNRAAFERVRVGMTLAEVEALLGGPPGDYRSREVDLDLSGIPDGFHNAMSAPEVLLGKRQFQHEWRRGDAGNAWVCFEEGRFRRTPPARTTPRG